MKTTENEFSATQYDEQAERTEDKNMSDRNYSNAYMGNSYHEIVLEPKIS